MDGGLNLMGNICHFWTDLKNKYMYLCTFSEPARNRHSKWTGKPKTSKDKASRTVLKICQKWLTDDPAFNLVHGAGFESFLKSGLFIFCVSGCLSYFLLSPHPSNSAQKVYYHIRHMKPPQIFLLSIHLSPSFLMSNIRTQSSKLSWVVDAMRLCMCLR